MDIDGPDLTERVEAARARREGRAPTKISELVTVAIRTQVDNEMRRFRRHQLAASAIAVVMLYAYYRWQEAHHG